MGNAKGSIWENYEAIKRLHELWTHHHSAGICAIVLTREFGHVTRNAVIGKTWRLGLRGPKTKQPSRKQRQRRREATMRMSQPPPLSGPIKMPTNEYNCQVIDLENCSCRWPFGDPQRDNFFFCGFPEANMAAGQAYCRYHTQRAAA